MYKASGTGLAKIRKAYVYEHLCSLTHRPIATQNYEPTEMKIPPLRKYKILFSKKPTFFTYWKILCPMRNNLKCREVRSMVCFYKTRLEAVFTIMEHMISFESKETWSTLDVQFHSEDEMK